MMRILGRVSLALLAFLFFSSSAVLAVTGQIQSISKRARTLQVFDQKTKQVHVVRLGSQTRYENAASLKEFIVNDKVVIDYEPGQPARIVKRVVIQVPPEKLISTQELSGLIARKAPMLLVDARPAMRFQEGHLPGAVSIPVGKMSKRLGELPADKNRLLVFYCGGPT